MATNLSTQKRIQRPFDYIYSGSAGRCLNDLFQRIRTDSVVNDWCQRVPDDQLSIKTDLKFRVTRTGRIRIRRFYWSLQRYTRSVSTGFSARTLMLDPESPPQWLDFPDDPQLPSALNLLGNGDHKHVLQYVPLRRLTVLRKCANDKSTVIKLKRAGRATDALRRLRQINTSYTTMPSRCSVPIDLGLCLRGRAFQQSYCPGTSLGELLQRSPPTAQIEQLGGSVAWFHTLHVSTLPAHHDDDLSVLTEKVRQLTALWPAESDRISECHDWLLRHSIPETGLTLCHGDLSLENMLVDGDQWSWIDLDLAHWGDPVRDIAQILVQLKANSPGSNNEWFAVRAAFLSGYQSVRPESVSSRALHWHGCRAELESLYIAFRKDIGNNRSRVASLLRAERHCRGID